MKRTRVNYTEEQIQFIRDLNDKCYNQEIIDKFYEKFGVQLTLPRLTHIKNVRKIKRVDKKYRSNSSLYRNGKKEFLEDLYFKGASHKEMIEKYNKEFNENITEPRLCSFIQWNIPNHKRNKMFNRKQKDFLIKLFFKGTNKYKIKKIYEEKFDEKIDIHYLNYLKKHLGIKDNKVTIFLDNNMNNVSKNNMKVISRGEYTFLSRNGFHKSTKDIKETALLLKKLSDKIKEKEEVF